jgi:hypothetical protein
VTPNARARALALTVLLLSPLFWTACKDLDIPTPLLAFSVNTLNFPPTVLGDTATATVILSTTTSETIGLADTDTADFPYTTTCTTSLPAGATCSVTIQFHPNTVGNLNAWLSVNSVSGVKASVQMTGAGVAASN